MRDSKIFWGFTLTIYLFALSLLSFADAPANYYSTVDSTNAATLRATLHNVIDDHTRHPYTSSSTDTWDIIEAADQDQTNASQISAIYKNIAYTKQGGGNALYNREHSWPKSLGFPDDSNSNYPYTDAHHLFASDISYNSDRGNKFFDNCSTNCTYRSTVTNDGRGGQSNSYPGDANWFDNDSWEVWSKRRGDIARAMLYMDVRYEGGQHSVTNANEPDLRLTDNTSLITSTGTNASIAYMGKLSVLLQWHAQDPVDDIERNRNDVVASFQGNRNPFVDHPEWVACIYENTCTSTPNPDGVIELNNGDTVQALANTSGKWLYYKIQLPNSASELSVSISGGSGDADLYVLHGKKPSSSAYECRPYLSGNNENCQLSTQAGEYFIGIHAYSNFNNVTLNVEYTSETGGQNPIIEEHLNISGNSGSWTNYPVTLPSGASQFEAQIAGGSGDADLYLNHSSLPTTSRYDCRPYLNGNNEKCTVTSPASGTWYVSLRGYTNYSGVNLRISYLP